MYYLDTNAVITMDKKGITLSEKQSNKLYTSLLVLQEIVKGIYKETVPADEVAIRLGHFNWLERNQVNIHRKSHIQCFGLAFGIELDFTLSKEMKDFYDQVINSEKDEYSRVIENHRKMLLFSDEQLKIMNKEMRKDLNKGIKESLDNSPVGKKAMQQLIAADGGEIEGMPSLRQILIDQISPIIIQGAFFSVNSITGNKIPPEEYQFYLNQYSKQLDAYAQMQLSFLRHHYLKGEIVYNDIPDIMHTVYLYNPSVKMVTNDRNLRKIIKQTLGQRYGLTLKEYLAKVK